MIQPKDKVHPSPWASLNPGQVDRLFRKRTGLAEVALGEVMAYLERDDRAESRFVGTVFSLRNYLLCMQALEAKGDARAGDLLGQAYTLLDEQAGHIGDEADRRSFLENIPWHREILQRWQTRRSNQLLLI